MGERIRAFNWDVTPLGPPQEWPQALKTLVNLLLASKQPMFFRMGSRAHLALQRCLCPYLRRQAPVSAGSAKHAGVR